MTLSNVTDVNVTSVLSIDYDPRKKFDWIFPVSCDVLFLASGIWILTSLVHYGIKTKQWKHQASRSDCDKLNAGKIYSSVIVCAVLGNVFFVHSLLVTTVSYKIYQDTLCEYLLDITHVIYALCLLSVQVFLWLRQQAFYTNRMLNVKYSKPVKVISFWSIIVIFVIGLVLAILYIYPQDSRSSVSGCILASAVVMDYAVTLLAAIFICQTTLLGLLVYALRQSSIHKPRQSTCHPPLSAIIITSCCCKSPSVEEPQENISETTYSANIASKNNTIGTSISISTISPAYPVTSSFQRTTSNAVRIIVRKTLVFAVVSFISHIVTNAVTPAITGPNNHWRFTSVAANANIFLNLLLVILSFAPYREMLTSPCRSYE